MDTIGLALIDAAEAEKQRHAAYRKTAPSLDDNTDSFRQCIKAIEAVQMHFNLPMDGTSFSWDELREKARRNEKIGEGE